MNRNTIKNTNRGISLIELIIVIAIMAILVGVLSPMFVKYVARSKKSKDVYTADQIARAVNVAFVENPNAYEEFQKWKSGAVKYPVTATSNGISETYDVYLIIANGDYPYCFKGTTTEFKREPGRSGRDDGSTGFYGALNRELGLSTTEDNGSIIKPSFTDKPEGRGACPVAGRPDAPYIDLNCWRIVKRADNGMMEIWAAQNPPFTGYPIYRVWPEPDDIYKQ